MAWVSPTGFDDPDGMWYNETRAYDEDTSGESYALNYSYSSGHYLELTLTTPISCDKVQIWLNNWPPTGNNEDVDVYYSDAWHNIHTGAITAGEWVEIAIGSTQTVSKARIKSNDATRDLRVWEFDFNEVEAPPPAYIPKVIGPF